MISELEKLKALMWEEWDPIGINETDCPRDEYDTYAHQVFSMLHNGSTREEILSYLVWARTEYIGMGEKGDPPSAADENTASRAMQIHEDAK